MNVRVETAVDTEGNRLIMQSTRFSGALAQPALSLERIGHDCPLDYKFRLEKPSFLKC